jgi:hypothetical protein
MFDRVTTLLSCLCVLLISCQVQPPDVEQAALKIFGAKIYEHEGDPEQLFAEWKKLGLNTAFVGRGLASQQEIRDAAASNSLELFVIFPVFFAPDELHSDPALYSVTADGQPAVDDWVEFACPTNPEFRRQRVREAVDTVTELQPDGLSIDFIRHFVFWEMVKPETDPKAMPDTCFCPRCLESFARKTGFSAPSEDPVEAAVWIRENADHEWTRFKTDTITSMADEIITAVHMAQPGIKTNLHIVPWREHDFEYASERIAGQDHSRLGELADYLSPMCYSFMQYRETGWVSSVVADIDRRAGCPVLPSIQVASAYRTGEQLSLDEFESCLLEALKAPSAGVVFWSWDHIAADPAKAEVIQKVLM